MRTWFAFLIVISSFSARAAVSPECVTPVIADNFKLYNAMGGIKLCTPTLDTDGDLLVGDELTFCSLKVTLKNGSGAIYRFAATPGLYLVIPPDPTWPKRASTSASCEGTGGVGPAGPTYDTLFRKGKPAPPWFLP